MCTTTPTRTSHTSARAPPSSCTTKNWMPYSPPLRLPPAYMVRAPAPASCVHGTCACACLLCTWYVRMRMPFVACGMMKGQRDMFSCVNADRKFFTRPFLRPGAYLSGNQVVEPNGTPTVSWPNMCSASCTPHSPIAAAPSHQWTAFSSDGLLSHLTPSIQS